MLTGVPFNDAYPYMDLWILTVPVLLLEILLAMVSVSGYYGESVVACDLTSRWLCWFCMVIAANDMVSTYFVSGIGKHFSFIRIGRLLKLTQILYLPRILVYQAAPCDAVLHPGFVVCLVLVPCDTDLRLVDCGPRPSAGHV